MFSSLWPGGDHERTLSQTQTHTYIHRKQSATHTPPHIQTCTPSPVKFHTRPVWCLRLHCGVWTAAVQLIRCLRKTSQRQKCSCWSVLTSREKKCFVFNTFSFELMLQGWKNFHDYTCGDSGQTLYSSLAHRLLSAAFTLVPFLGLLQIFVYFLNGTKKQKKAPSVEDFANMETLWGHELMSKLNVNIFATAILFFWW